MLVVILSTSEGWKAEWTLARKKVTQIFNPRSGRGSNRAPQDWEAEILPLRQPLHSKTYCNYQLNLVCWLKGAEFSPAVLKPTPLITLQSSDRPKIFEICTQHIQENTSVSSRTNLTTEPMHVVLCFISAFTLQSKKFTTKNNTIRCYI